MPLTIKPVQNAALALATGSDREDYYLGPIYIWWADVLEALRDPNGDEYLLTEPGWLKTTKSIWCPGQHDCDNLQLEGDLLDMRFLTNAPVSYRYTTQSGSVIPMSGYWATISGRQYFLPLTRIAERNSQELFTVTEYYGGIKHTKIFGYVCSNTDIAKFEYEVDNRTQDVGIYCILQRIRRVGSAWKYFKSEYYQWEYGVKMNYDLGMTVLAHLRTHLDTNWTYNLRENSFPLTNVVATSIPAADAATLSKSYRFSDTSWLSSFGTLTNDDFGSQFGELHYRALKKIDLNNVNGIAYLNDLRNIIEEIKGIFSLLKGKITPKTLSSLFLEYKYGLTATYRDTLSYASSIAMKPKSGVSATESYVDGGRVIKVTSTIRYKELDSRLENAYRVFRYLGLLANPKNLWDLVPFSFVVDWFYDIGHLLDELDQFDHVQHLDVLAVFDSSIIEGSLPVSSLCPKYTGNISYKRYRRTCTWDASFPLIAPSLSPEVTSHWLEGTALIIQKLK